MEKNSELKQSIADMFLFLCSKVYENKYALNALSRLTELALMSDSKYHGVNYKKRDEMLRKDVEEINEYIKHRMNERPNT